MGYNEGTVGEEMSGFLPDGWREEHAAVCDQYVAKFGEDPGLGYWPRLDPSKWIPMMREAIRTGKPLVAPEIPEGILV
jgi:hypothetical protein